MSIQRFHASLDNKMTWPNGAVGQRPGGAFDCLGPYARVTNCPVYGTELRLTCYATAYADSAFTVPAATQYRRKYVRGFFDITADSIMFHVVHEHYSRVGLT